MANPVPVTQAEIASLKAESKGYRIWVTRRINIIEATLKELDKEGAVFSINTTIQLQGLLKDYEEAYAKLVKGFAMLMIVEPGSENRLQGQLNDLVQANQPILSKATAMFGKLPVVQPPVQQPQGANRGQQPAAVPSAAKANMALKPGTLSLDHTPVEVARWKETWNSFYRTSNLILLSAEDQLSYFMAFLDDTLREVIRGKIAPNSPVYGDLSVMASLDETFLERYPLFQRREVFFEAKFKGGIRDLPSFLNRLEALGQAAELEKLDRASLVAYKGLSAISDRELKRLASREEELTLERFRQLCIQRVREQENMTHIESAAMGVNAVTGNCHYCGRKGHFAKDCMKRKKDQKEGGNWKKSSKEKKERTYSHHKRKTYRKKSSYQKNKARQVKEKDDKDNSSSSSSDSSSQSSSSGEEEEDNEALLVSTR